LLEDAGARKRISAASREIDRRLLESPYALGESRFDGMRIGFASPLGVYFEILNDVNTVIVFDVWRTDLKRS
jgi:hypothetical protein